MVAKILAVGGGLLAAAHSEEVAEAGGEVRLAEVVLGQP